MNSTLPMTPAARMLAPYAAIVAVGAATVGGLMVGNPIFALAPVGLAAGAYVLFRLPLRWSTSGLLVAMLVIDNHQETHGQWRTPLAVIGDLFHGRLDQETGIPGLPITGMEVIVFALLAIAAYRRATGSTIDGTGQVAPASILRGFIVLYVAGVLFSELVGLARGLPLAPWKLRNLLHPVLLTILFLQAYRPRDHLLIGRVIVFAACCRAVLAYVVQAIGNAETGGHWLCATSHGDSMIFAMAFFVLVVGVLEKPDRRRLLRAALFVPLVMMGAMTNERRIVWVMISLSLGFAYLVSPLKGWKLLLTRALLVAVPLVVLYVAVGWNRQGSIFKPISILRSVSDTSADHSAYWREVEIWNIATSMRAHPLTGVGLGGEYTETMANDDISVFYKEYREWPHNTVLGLLMLMGYFAFTAHWLLLPIAVFFALRAYRSTADPELRLAALACAGTVVACLVMDYGDTGAHYVQVNIAAGLALAVSSKLAVLTGAWPAPARSQRGEPSPITNVSSALPAASHE